MKRYHIALDQIKEFAPRLAKELKGGEILALTGELGAGKTTFVKHLGKALGIRKTITSPTFTIVQTYEGRLKNKRKPVMLYHLDLYRLRGIRDTHAVGLQEFWGKADTITAIEWADRIMRYLPKKAIVIYF